MFEPSTFLQHNQKITKVIDEAIVRDATQLFNGERTGHVAYLAYGTSEAIDDNVFGSDMWIKLRNHKDYYVAREDDDLLKKAISRMAPLNIRVRTFIDLGPGDRAAIKSKTIPLLQSLHAQKYIAVDMAAHYAHEAANYVTEVTNIKSQAEVADFFESTLPFKRKRAFLFIGGSTLSNLSIDIRVRNPILQVSENLSRLRKTVDNQSYLLVGFDANQDGEMIKAAYGSDILARMIEDTMWRIARDTDIEFDPSAFKYHGEWIADEHRFAHCVKATRNCIVRLRSGTVNIPKGKVLHLQNSFKFPVSFLEKAAENAGWKIKMVWSETDRCHYALFEAI